MKAGWTQVVLVLLPVVVGALIGVVPTMLAEWARTRNALRTRWDPVLQTTCAQFAAKTRELIEIAERAAEARAGNRLEKSRRALADANRPEKTRRALADPNRPEKSRRALLESMDREHAALQVLLAEVRLLAGAEVQLAARQVVRHAWALQQESSTGVDPRAVDFPDRRPRQRTLDSLFTFYRAVRVQLRVPDADDLAPLNPPI